MIYNENLCNYFMKTPGNIDQISLSFDQISLIMDEDLPEDAYKKSNFWNNNPITAIGTSRSWLEAGWKVERINLFNHEITFVRLGLISPQNSGRFIKKVSLFFEGWKIKYLNKYPKDLQHYIGIETQSKKLYWLIIDEDFPNEIYIGRFGKMCGYIKFSCKGKSIEIHDILIFKDHRGDGLGSYLMKEFLSLAQRNGFETIEAGVQPEDDFPLEKLMAWYRRFGFISSSTNARWMTRIFKRQLDKTFSINNIDPKMIRKIVNDSLFDLRNFDKELLKNNVAERAITHKLAEYIEKRIPYLDVDCEYNRNVEEGFDKQKSLIALTNKFTERMIEISEKLKRIKINIDDDGNVYEECIELSVYPDIIIHKRGSNSKNLLVIEVKKHNNEKLDEIELDHIKLESFTDRSSYNPYKYKFGVFILLHTGANYRTQPELKWFVNGSWNPNF